MSYRTIPQAELLAYLRSGAQPLDDLVAILAAASSAYSLTPEIQDALDGAIGEIEGYQDRKREEEREEAEFERQCFPRRRNWAQDKDREEGIIPGFLSNAI